MKSVLFAILLAYSPLSLASTPVVQLSTDRSYYDIDDKAVLRAMLTSKPDNSTMEFDVEGKLNGVLFPISRVTDFEFFSVTDPLSAGDYTWETVVYLQDARLARDLKLSISCFTSEIAKIDLALETEVDPVKIEELQAKKAKYQALMASSQNQLNAIRTQVYGPVSIQFQVN